MNFENKHSFLMSQYVIDIHKFFRNIKSKRLKDINLKSRKKKKIRNNLDKKEHAINIDLTSFIDY